MGFLLQLLGRTGLGAGGRALVPSAARRLAVPTGLGVGGGLLGGLLTGGAQPRRRRRRMLTASDRADIAFLSATLGKTAAKELAAVRMASLAR